jgi:hypothetical protein
MTERHGGDVPGFTSQVTRVPALGVGFFTAINDDDVGASLKPAIVYRILDDLLGLQPIDWEERLVSRAYKKEPAYTRIPEHPRPAPRADLVTGHYRAHGYAAMDIQNIDDVAASRGDLTPAALDAIRDAMKLSEGVSEPMYIAKFPKVFAAVMVFSHFDGPIFNTTVMSISEGKKGRLVANVGGTNSAVFHKGEGMGMFEDFWGGAKIKPAVEEDVEVQSEVWFSRT